MFYENLDEAVQKHCVSLARNNRIIKAVYLGVSPYNKDQPIIYFLVPSGKTERFFPETPASRLAEQLRIFEIKMASEFHKEVHTLVWPAFVDEVEDCSFIQQCIYQE